MSAAPTLSVITPTFNNLETLKRALDGWRTFGGPAIEVVIVEDGCRDGTADFLRTVEQTPWGRDHLRWIHQDDAHELRCTNSGFQIARGDFLMAWQDDMFLQVPWLVPELVQTFRAYPAIGLISLSRGVNCLPLDEPIERWGATISAEHPRARRTWWRRTTAGGWIDTFKQMTRYAIRRPFGAAQGRPGYSS